MQEHCCDRNPGGDLVFRIASRRSSRGRSNKRALEVQQRGPESMALAKHQLHDHGIFFVFRESVEAEALSWKTGRRISDAVAVPYILNRRQTPCSTQRG